MGKNSAIGTDKIDGLKNASKKEKYPTYRKKKSRIHKNSRLYGGDKRDRTADLLNAIQALSQLSYTPIFGCAVCTASVLYQPRGDLSIVFAEKLEI